MIEKNFITENLKTNETQTSNNLKNNFIHRLQNLSWTFLWGYKWVPPAEIS